MRTLLHGRWSIVAVLAIAGALVALPTTTALAAPVITAPANQTVDNDPGQPGAIVNYPAPTVSGTDGPITVVCTPPSGSFFPIGATVVTCTATDTTGTSSAVLTVTVLATFPTSSPRRHHDGHDDDERDPAPAPPRAAQAVVTTPAFTG